MQNSSMPIFQGIIGAAAGAAGAMGGEENNLFSTEIDPTFGHEITTWH